MFSGTAFLCLKSVQVLEQADLSLIYGEYHEFIDYQ